MPIYEYKCEKCLKISSRLKTGSVETKELNHVCLCDYCGYPADKIISASSFKINGYNYKNGYSKDGK